MRRSRVLRHSFVLCFAALGCRAAAPTQAPSFRVGGTDSGGALELAVTPTPGAFHALGALDGRAFAFVESDALRVTGTFLFEDGSEVEGALWVTSSGPVSVEVGERAISVSRSAEERAVPPVRRYLDGGPAGGVLNLSLQREGGLFVGAGELFGANITVAGRVVGSSFVGDLREAGGVRVPVRGSFRDGVLEIALTPSRTVVLKETR